MESREDNSRIGCEYHGMCNRTCSSISRMSSNSNPVHFSVYQIKDIAVNIYIEVLGDMK